MCARIFLVDKPVGFSSFQVVRIFKNKFRKVGHSGTLDPFASGLLIILTGRATRKFEEFLKYDKEYEGEILLGMVSKTFDVSEYPVMRTPAGLNLSQKELQRIARDFEGEIYQIPPRYAALKIKGRTLYSLARKGVDVEPPKRKVHIKSFTITAYHYPSLRFRAVVSKGVYLRSLAYDFGERLGCGGLLLTLRRTRIGKYKVDAARRIGDYLNNYYPEPVDL